MQAPGSNPGPAYRHEPCVGCGQTFVLSVAAVDLGRARFLRVRRGAVRIVLHREPQPSQSTAGKAHQATAAD